MVLLTLPEQYENFCAPIRSVKGLCDGGGRNHEVITVDLKVTAITAGSESPSHKMTHAVPGTRLEQAVHYNGSLTYSIPLNFDLDPRSPIVSPR